MVFKRKQDLTTIHDRLEHAEFLQRGIRDALGTMATMILTRKSLRGPQACAWLRKGQPVVRSMSELAHGQRSDARWLGCLHRPIQDANVLGVYQLFGNHLNRASGSTVCMENRSGASSTMSLYIISISTS